MATQPTLLDDEGNKLAMPRLKKTLGITLDTVFTPMRMTCGKCRGIAWGWRRSEEDPTGPCVCLVCTGETGVTYALIALDIERTRLGLGPIDPLVLSAMFHAPYMPMSHLPESGSGDEDYEPRMAVTWLPTEFDDDLPTARDMVEFPYDVRLALWPSEVKF